MKIDVDALLLWLDYNSSPATRTVISSTYSAEQAAAHAAATIRALRAEHEALRADFELVGELAERLWGGRGPDGRKIRAARARWAAQEKT